MVGGRTLALAVILVGTVGAAALAQPGGSPGVGDCAEGPLIEERTTVPVRSVDAGLSRDHVARIVLRERGRLGHCAFVAFGRTSHPPHDVRVAFDVLPDGSTSGIVVRDDGGPPSLADCLTTTFGRLVFPAPTTARAAHVELVVRFTTVPRAPRCALGIGAPERADPRDQSVPGR